MYRAMLAMLLLSSSCASISPLSELDTVQLRSSHDFSCDGELVRVEPVGGHAYRATGCGRSADYACESFGSTFNPNIYCRREAPLAPAAPEAPVVRAPPPPSPPHEFTAPELSERMANAWPESADLLRVQQTGPRSLSVTCMGCSSEQIAACTAALRRVLGRQTVQCAVASN